MLQGLFTLPVWGYVVVTLVLTHITIVVNSPQVQQYFPCRLKRGVQFLFSGAFMTDVWNWTHFNAPHLS